MNSTVGTINNVNVQTKTPAGAAYVRKACHPPSPLDSAYEGRPDCSAPNVVMMELKSESNFAPILTLASNATTTKTSNPSSMLFLQPPGAYVGNYLFMLTNDFTGPVTSGWVQPINFPAVPNICPAISQFNAPEAIMNGYNFDNITADVARYRVTYKSSTYYLNATDFNNQGTVTTAKIRPNVSYGLSQISLFKEHKDDPASLRSLKNALKEVMDQHNNTCKPNDKLRYSEDGYDVLDAVGATTTNFVFQILEFGPGAGLVSAQAVQGNMGITNCFPSTASELLVQSPKAATRPAKEGAFVVLQQAGPTLDWIDIQDTTIASQQEGFSQTGLPKTLMRVRVFSGTSWSWQYQSIFSSRTDNAPRPLSNTQDTIWDGLDWSVTLFEGLTVPSTTGTSLSTVPYITVKTIVGLEVVPQLKSSLQCFSRTLPMPDQDAIDMVVGIMHARPDSLPASSNDLGSIAKVAVRYLPDAIDWLKNLFGSKKEQTKAIKVITPPKTAKAKKEKPAAERKPKNSADRKAIAELSSKIDMLMKATKQPSRLPTYSNSTTFSKKKKLTKQTDKYHRKPN